MIEKLEQLHDDAIELAEANLAKIKSSNSFQSRNYTDTFARLIEGARECSWIAERLREQRDKQKEVRGHHAS